MWDLHPLQYDMQQHVYPVMSKSHNAEVTPIRDTHTVLGLQGL